MTISTRSTKSAIYSELETFRTAYDRVQSELRGEKLERARLASRLEELERLLAELQAVKPAAPAARVPVAPKLNLLRKLAMKYHTTSRFNADGEPEVYSKARKLWVVVPTAFQA